MAASVAVKADPFPPVHSPSGAKEEMIKRESSVKVDPEIATVSIKAKTMNDAMIKIKTEGGYGFDVNDGMAEHAAGTIEGVINFGAAHLQPLPKPPLPPAESYVPVENFVNDAVASRCADGETAAAADPKAARGYRALIDLLRKRDDPAMLYKVLLALRTAGHGSVLGRVSGNTKGHAHLLHLIFKLDPFVPSGDLMRPLRVVEENARARAARAAAMNETVEVSAEDMTKHLPSGKEWTKLKSKTQPYWSYEVADAHFHLVIALVSANSVFLSPALGMLWRCLTDVDVGSPGGCSGGLTMLKVWDETVPEHQLPLGRTRRAHAALSTILRLCPRGKSDIFSHLASNYPFKLASSTQQIWYARQCLVVSQYTPTIHGQLLSLFIDRALEMDVEIKIEEGGGVTLEKGVDGEDDVDATRDEIFELEMDPKVGEKVATVESESGNHSEKVDELADRLDSLMHIIFQHLTVVSKSNGKSATRQMYQMIAPVFESTILTTHRSKFVQFVVLLLCGLEEDAANSADGGNGAEHLPSLYREFAAKLIDVVLDPYRATVTRQCAACYLASFVSRASFVCAETACESIAALLRWAIAYISTFPNTSRGARPLQEKSAREQCEMHSLFYTICQAAFYIMCFRGGEAVRYHREAVAYHAANGADEKAVEEDTLYADPEHIDIAPARWAKICSHHLQPLRYCLESVRGEFLHVSETFGLLEHGLLKTLVLQDKKMASGQMKQKRKVSLITTAATLEKKRLKGGVGGLGRGSNPLDSFFPFDPYLLRRSHPFIEPYYKNWDGSVERLELDAEPQGDDIVQTESSSDDEGSSSDTDDEEDDEQPQHMQGTTQAMSLASTPGSDVMGINDNVAIDVPFDKAVAMKNSNFLTPQDLWSQELRRSRTQSVGSASSW